MKWQLFRLRRWLREWLEAAPQDDFWRLYSNHHAAEHTLNVSIRTIVDRQKCLDEHFKALCEQQKLFALRMAKYDIEQVERKSDTTKSA